MHRRMIIAIIVIGVFCIMACGCGGQDSPTSFPPATETPHAQIETENILLPTGIELERDEGILPENSSETENVTIPTTESVITEPETTEPAVTTPTVVETIPTETTPSNKDGNEDVFEGNETERDG